MNLPLPPARDRDLLCVTPPHEDEGYLSPSEEDLKRSYLARGLHGSYLDCKLSTGLSLAIPRSKTVDGCFGDGVGTEEEDIDWEKLACLPDIREEHLSWDRLKLPVPYRFYDEHRLCLRQVRKTPQVSYITDSIEKHAKVVENIWRLYDTEKQSEDGDGAEAIKTIKSGKEPISYISTKEFVRDIFNLLCGRESLSFSHVPGENFAFMKNPRILVNGLSPGLLANLSGQFLTSGKIFKRLSIISALHFDEKLMEREGFQSNAVFTAFLKFISDYLKLYQTSLMLKASRIQSVGSLNVFFKPFYYQLQTLEWTLDLYISTDQITLLKGLNSMMLNSETPFVADLLRSAFITCAAAYLRYVSEWIFRGQLTKGFHIQRTKSSTYQDRRYWVKQFSQVASVPTFMESAVNAIFEAGKAINLLNLIRNSDSRSALISCVLHDDSSIIRPAVEFEEVIALEKEWKIKMESFFEEYSFLEADIEAALLNAGEEKKTVIDFEAVKEAKHAFEIKNREMRRNIADRKMEKQQRFRNALNEQMAEKQCREKLQKEADIAENEKITMFIKTRDQRDLKEEIRLMKKHFGERTSDTVGLRNVKARIAASSPGKFTEEDSAVPLEIIDDVQIAEAVMPSPLEDNDQVFQRKIKVDSEDSALNDKGGDRQLEDNVLPQKEISSLVLKTKHVSFMSDTTDNDNAVTNKRNIDPEEKFNSDNLKIRSLVPYNINLDFESLATGTLSKSLLNFSDSALASQDHESSIQSNEDKKNSFRHDSFCLNFCLNQSVAAPVEAQNRMINSTLLHYFIVEKRLFQHVEALNSFLCVQNGLFGHFLTNLLIQEVKNGTLSSKEDIPRKAGRLTELLGEAVALSTDGAERSDIRDHLGFILVRESNRNSMNLDSQQNSAKSRTLKSAYEVLNDLTINYSVEWPLSILLTDDLLINYEKLFTFQVRLYRAELLLLGISSFLKFKGNKSRQLPILHHYRYRMLHFVRTVRHYINVTVIHCAWTELASSFHKMNSLDKLYEGLVRHIKFVTTNCLLGTKGEGVRKLLLDQLIVIECFCKDVEDFSAAVNSDAGEEIHPKEFAKLDQKFKVWEEIQKVFIQVFFKLATKGTYQKVSYFLQLFNFNGYFGNNMLE